MKFTRKEVIKMKIKANLKAGARNAIDLVG